MQSEFAPAPPAPGLTQLKAFRGLLDDNASMQGQALIHAISTPNAPLPSRAQPASAVPASVFLPKEHGSWSLALEPLALGLLVAPSLAGTALVAAALAGFFARRPLKAALETGQLAQRQRAREALAALSALAVVGLFEVAVLGEWRTLWPLLGAAPLGLLFAYFDGQGEARAAAAEIAGSAAFAVVPAALTTLAGWSAGAALALAAVMLARSVPTVLTVRTAVRLAKRQPADALDAMFAAELAFLAIFLLAALRLAPPLTIFAAGLLFGRTLWFASAFRPAWPARRIGIFEAVLGGLYLGTVALAYRWQ